MRVVRIGTNGDRSFNLSDLVNLGVAATSAAKMRDRVRQKKASDAFPTNAQARHRLALDTLTSSLQQRPRLTHRGLHKAGDSDFAAQYAEHVAKVRAEHEQRRAQPLGAEVVTVALVLGAALDALPTPRGKRRPRFERAIFPALVILLLAGCTRAGTSTTTPVTEDQLQCSPIDKTVAAENPLVCTEKTSPFQSAIGEERTKLTGEELSAVARVITNLLGKSGFTSSETSPSHGPLHFRIGRVSTKDAHYGGSAESIYESEGKEAHTSGEQHVEGGKDKFRALDLGFTGDLRDFVLLFAHELGHDILYRYPEIKAFWPKDRLQMPGYPTRAQNHPEAYPGVILDPQEETRAEIGQRLLLDPKQLLIDVVNEPLGLEVDKKDDTVGLMGKVKMLADFYAQKGFALTMPSDQLVASYSLMKQNISLINDAGNWPDTKSMFPYIPLDNEDGLTPLNPKAGNIAFAVGALTKTGNDEQDNNFVLKAVASAFGDKDLQNYLLYTAQTLANNGQEPVMSVEQLKTLFSSPLPKSISFNLNNPRLASVDNSAPIQTTTLKMLDETRVMIPFGNFALLYAPSSGNAIEIGVRLTTATDEDPNNILNYAWGGILKNLQSVDQDNGTRTLRFPVGNSTSSRSSALELALQPQWQQMIAKRLDNDVPIAAWGPLILPPKQPTAYRIDTGAIRC
ncbi:MAG: hypothetical protein WCP97_04845 [bacterium]